jgi:hypothetical protein
LDSLLRRAYASWHQSSRYPLSSLPGDWRLWNEAVGLPKLPANDQPHALLQYQDDIGEYEGKDVIVNKANKCGVTETLLRKLAWMCTKPGGELSGYDVILGSSLEELAAENMRRLQHLFTGSVMLRPFIQEAIATRFVLADGTRFLTMPSNPTALRSWPRVKAVFLDEAGHIGRLDDTEYFAAASSRLANTNGYMYVVSTPHGQRGFFYDLWVKALEGKVQMKAFTLPYTVGMGVFYEQEFIDKEKDRLGPRFAGEYNCEFLGAENAAIEKELLERGKGDYDIEAL